MKNKDDQQLNHEPSTTEAYNNKDYETSLEFDNLKPFSNDEDKQEFVAHRTPSFKELDTGRQRWTNSREYLLCCIGMAVGLGNVWRFPWVALKNGGGKPVKDLCF